MKLRWFCKKLKNCNKIYGFGVDNRSVWLKADEKSRKKRVEVTEDLELYIPVEGRSQFAGQQVQTFLLVENISLFAFLFFVT